MPGYLDAMAAASHTSLPAAAECPQLLVRRLDLLPDAERAFVSIYRESQNAFWLDSVTPGERGRFSFIGDSGGPLGAVVSYDVGDGRVRISPGGGVEVREESVFDYLEWRLRGLRPLTADLPFDFDCGLVGYFGYELKADCDGGAAHRSRTPDAAFIFADRLIAFDHEQRHTYLLALVGTRPGLHRLLRPLGREGDAVRLLAAGGGASREASPRARRRAPPSRPA